MESLQQVFYQSGMSQRMAAIIVTAIIVPLSQVCLPRYFNAYPCSVLQQGMRERVQAGPDS